VIEYEQKEAAEAEAEGAEAPEAGESLDLEDELD